MLNADAIERLAENGESETLEFKRSTGQRTDAINIDNTIARIEQGAGTALAFDTLLGGHHHCNRYAFAFVINGKLYDALNEPDLAVPFMNQTAHVAFDRRDPRKTVRAVCIAVLKKPSLWFASLRWCARLVWRAPRGHKIRRNRPTIIAPDVSKTYLSLLLLRQRKKMRLR